MVRARLILGVVGGSASGKSTFAAALCEAFGPRAALLEEDGYYRVGDAVPRTRDGDPNYDHPEAKALDLFAAHVAALRDGAPIESPVYDFAAHAPAGVRRVAPAEVIVLDGMFLLAAPALRGLLDHAFFMSAEAETRLARRLARDCALRGRDEASVRRQFALSVEPMHAAFVEPQAALAHEIIPEGESLADLRRRAEAFAARR